MIDEIVKVGVSHVSALHSCYVRSIQLVLLLFQPPTIPQRTIVTTTPSCPPSRILLRFKQSVAVRWLLKIRPTSYSYEGLSLTSLRQNIHDYFPSVKWGIVELNYRYLLTGRTRDTHRSLNMKRRMLFLMLFWAGTNWWCVIRRERQICVWCLVGAAWLNGKDFTSNWVERERILWR